MSRIYAKRDDIVNFSECINAIKIKKHKSDNEIIPWNEVALGANNLELFLTDDCIKYLTSKPIAICKDPFSFYTRRSIPKDNEQTMISFPSFRARKEYQRELVFALGLMLSLNKLDNEQSDYSFIIQDEFRDVLPLYAEYLYLRDIGKEDTFSLKRLEELKTRTKDFPASIMGLKSSISRSEGYIRNSAVYSPKVIEDSERVKDCCIEDVEKLTHETLIPVSSMDATLQLIDKNLSKEQIKEFIDKMFKNESGNRADIVAQYGVVSNNYKRLIKEYEKNKR